MNAGIPHDHLEHEAVNLRFRQKVGAFGLDGVLGGQHQEGIRQPEGLGADGDLPLLHGFQQRRLNLGGGAVDLVGQNQLGEDRAEFNLKRPFLLVIDAGADQVGGHQIGREPECA